MFLSTYSLYFPSSGGQQSFSVESNTNKWTVSSNVSSWLTFSPETGEGNGSVTVTVAPNTETNAKPATITVSGTGVTDQKLEVTVNRAAPTLTLSPASLNFDAAEGNKTFTVTSNISWSLSRMTDDARSWITLSRSSLTINGSTVETTVTLNAKANKSSSPREAKIAAFGTNGSVDTTYLIVTQAGVILSASMSYMNFSSYSEQNDFTIVSNTSWEITSNQAWCTVQPASGADNRSITVSVTENTNTTSRQATLSITAGDINEQVTIYQEGRGVESEFGNGIVAASSFGGGNGTENEPYLIYNAQELKKWVDDDANYHNSWFKLMNNIQVTANEWAPINAFGGHFDGGGHTISGSMRSDRFKFFGFFGSLSKGAHVSNLKIAASVYNDGDFSSSSESYVYTGAIAGISSNATISDCEIYGSVTGGIALLKFTGGVLGVGSNDDVIQNCTVTGKIFGGNTVGTNVTSTTGGIAGRIMGEIINCTVLSTAQIISDVNDVSSYTGGIAGQNNNNIANCTNHAIVTGGLYVGGLVGSNYGVIHSSLNDGNISGSYDNSGGLAGLNNNYSYVHIYECCTNKGYVRGYTANQNNRIGVGKGVDPCPNNH